ncbi:MAG TPA: GIY-YIG nuclease family protein [Candidatus Omnitrophota bacterium]|nr:GIY-YIG nuclease family protein [Candidatus Omnitrophota bacterium]
MHYVYVLKNKSTQDLYYGYSSNLKRRMAEHQAKGSWELKYYEAYRSETDARDRERKLKHYAQALTALKQRIKRSLS